jgi:hypothetical protein
MPFALREYDEAFLQFTHRIVNGLATVRDPVLSQMGPPVADSTTVASRVRGRDGVDVDLPPAKVGFEFTTDFEAVRRGDVESYAQQVDEAAEHVTREMLQLIFGSLDAVTSATGMVVDAAGRPTFEAVYEMLDKIEYGLTDEDELSLPTIVGGADVLKSFELFTEQQAAAIESLKARKHEELLARRRRRRLS